MTLMLIIVDVTMISAIQHMPYRNMNYLTTDATDELQYSANTWIGRDS